jgi:hypothetical protein
MSENALIIKAIDDLQERIDKRFDTVDSKFDGLDARTRAVERDITRVKSVGSVVSLALTVVGWDHIKPWLTSLTK